MTPSLMLRKVYPINPENSMKVQINTTPKTKNINVLSIIETLISAS